nr:hypothetical protein [Tanacetum cinerariifolium]
EEVEEDDQGLRANRGVKGVNRNVEGVNGGVGGAPDFLTIIAQQLQNLLPAMLAQVANQGNVGNQNGNVVNENVQENVGNVLVNGNWVGCSYKEFLACNPKEYDVELSDLHAKPEVAVSMSWNDFKFMMIEEFCLSYEIQKLETKMWNHAMVGAGHAAYTDRFYELARLVPHLVTPESRKFERNVNPINARNPTLGHVMSVVVPTMSGMDWLSNHKAEITCHKKVVRISLLDGMVLRVLGERPKEKVRLLMSAKASDKKQGEIVVVRDFLEVFSDDLSGLSPV